MINVLHITVRADRGGGPKHILELLTGLNNHHITHWIAAPSVGEYVTDFQTHTQGYCEIPARQFQISALLALRRFAKHHHIHLIHSHGRGAGIYGRLLGRLTGLPVIHTHHGLYLEKYTGLIKQGMVRLERLLNYATTRIVFVSPSELAACRAAGAYAPDKSIIIPNCVTIPNTTNTPTRHTPDLRLLAVTRLEAEKGNSTLLDIMAALSQHTRQFQLLIVGDGPERTTLQQKIHTLGLEHHVTLLGGRDDVPQLMQNADAYITASHGEAHSIAMLEAMSHGLPVIASRVRGHIDMIDDDHNGLLFDLNTPQHAALTVQRLINTPQLATRLGKAGQQFVSQNYSIEIMLNKLASLYRELMSC